MLQRTYGRFFITKIFKVSKPPAAGYEIAELPNEKVLQDYLQFHRAKGVVVILHSGPPYAAAAVASAGGSPSPLTSAHTHTSTTAAASRGKSGGNAAAAKSSKDGSYLMKDALTRSFISSINALNLGNPSEVKLALVPGPQAPRLVEEYNVITYPTTLLFLDGQCVYRVVGARTRELSIKSLFMLRNGGRNIFSRE
ncbi:putative mitochondrial hypothetical protein [Leptomonas pyrrhocoris]|uniref:Thioredoxin domain-containing protein n=1 Tax=Leptomonas pyrrhocoris TaxID=157538 RepID=A0A0M9G4Q0_LEPPY|nr:putative mitochondrial hypothetical protein [Leptomonas pyrrhocoris]XP_015660809.1 putative mitochondrial hypothetical protein [Leptomonas pyrrhocoris]KPA82369.1 putative mitochondrial hypothetical protein [Leptomonas pyrrhocoris]KPA82370.1 putative mitochondrial hypothetical protein [Leptomonas pyrrhocoris]|eukprot:XP_015660808.1 putative mitochondrial hypothetical protein [Leptomonas pyrrhocoris]